MYNTHWEQKRWVDRCGLVGVPREAFEFRPHPPWRPSRSPYNFKAIRVPFQSCPVIRYFDLLHRATKADWFLAAGDNDLRAFILGYSCWLTF
jgi:hypothetical protein